MDLVKTIDDNEEVENYSEESGAEEEFQPIKGKRKQQEYFSSGFEFAIDESSVFKKDNYVERYLRGTGKTRVDDKINKFLRERRKKKKEAKEIDVVESSDEDYEISEDELKPDNIKVKQSSVTVLKKSPGGVEIEDFFEDAPPFDENSSFYEMNLSRPLMKAISVMNFSHPTPIQAATIPVALLGRDVCGCAATGTGKTAAYMLPTLERLLYRPANFNAITRVLVLVPTRELGVQVHEVSKRLAEFTSVEIGLAVGGLDLKLQEIVLRKNPDIVIATPGRLIDHLKNTPSFCLDSIEVLILDEADRILDEYFAAQLKEIVNQCSRKRQTLLFSATMTTEVQDLAAVSLNKPVKIFVDSNQEVASNLQQEFVRVRTESQGVRECILAALVCRTFRDHALIFVSTKKQAHRTHIMLGLLGLKVGELHGNLTQPQRLEALRRFKQEEIDVLIATDVAARGLDIVGVKSVINFTMPHTREHYIHRVGRTARAGRSGISVSLVGDSEYKVVKEIIKNSSRPPKNRVIPQDILTKYHEKLEKIEPEIEAIIKEEDSDRKLLMYEIKLNLAEKTLKNTDDPGGEKREWFQTQRERLEERKRLQFPTTAPEKVSKKNKRREAKKMKAKERLNEKPIPTENNNLPKKQYPGTRAIKKKSRPGRIFSMGDDFKQEPENKSSLQKTRKRSRKIPSFESALTDCSTQGVKSLRYQGNVHKRLNEFDSKKGKSSRFMNKNTKKRRYK